MNNWTHNDLTFGRKAELLLYELGIAVGETARK